MVRKDVKQFDRNDQSWQPAHMGPKLRKRRLLKDMYFYLACQTPHFCLEHSSNPVLMPDRVFAVWEHWEDPTVRGVAWWLHRR